MRRSRRRVRATAELSRAALTMARGVYLARPTPDSVSGTARHRRRRRQHGRHPTSTDPHVITIIHIAESRQTLVRSHGSRDHDVTNLINIKEVMCKCYNIPSSSDLSPGDDVTAEHTRDAHPTSARAGHGPRSSSTRLMSAHMLLYSVHTPCVHTHDVTFHTYACTQRNARAHAPHQPWCSCDATASGWLWPVHLEHLGGKFHTAATQTAAACWLAEDSTRTHSTSRR